MNLDYEYMQQARQMLSQVEFKNQIRVEDVSLEASTPGHLVQAPSIDPSNSQFST